MAAENISGGDVSVDPITEARLRKLTTETIAKVWRIVGEAPDDMTNVAMIDALCMVTASLLMALPSLQEPMLELVIARMRGQFHQMMTARSVVEADREGRVAAGSDRPS